MKKIIALILALVMMSALCLCSSAEEAKKEEQLPDGTYIAQFDTDSTMFHVNEAKEGKGILTVKDGEMTIHISLVSKSILNLFPGLAEDAQKEGAVLLEPTTDSVTYSDGYTEDVYGFDVPVPYLDEEFDLALIGKKGEWYDHKVSVSDPKPAGKTPEELKLEDGVYRVNVAMEGGSGKASVQSPCKLEVKEGKAAATIIWSSDKYDYMKIGEEQYLPVTLEGGSTFEIPVELFDAGMTVIADTTAMSQPHEIEYTFTFDSESIEKEEK